MGHRRIGLARIEGLLENLKREITLTGTTLVQSPAAVSGGYAIASATVVDKSHQLNNETFTLVDAYGTSHTFTFKTADDVVTGNKVGIQTASAGGGSATAVAAQIVAAVNSSTATTSGLIEADNASGVVTFRQLISGTDGNRTNSETVANASFVLTNFLGGAGYGAGAVSTEIAPKTYIEKVGGDIITTVEVDLTDLKIKATNNDAIGLASGAAYILETRDSRNGIIYKADMICLETPVDNNADAKSPDIDLAVSTSFTLAYDGAVGTDKIINGGVHAKNSVKTGLVMPVDMNKKYLYLVTGDAPNADGTYTAGKFVIRLYGRASF